MECTISIYGWHDSGIDDEILEKANLSYRCGQTFIRSEMDLGFDLATEIAADIFKKTKLNVMLLKYKSNITIAITSYGNFGQRG